MKFARDNRGMAVVEFALLSPLMLLMLIGTVEVGNLIATHRRVSAVATTAADLLSNYKTVTAADVTAVFDTASKALDPYSHAPLKIVLSSAIASSASLAKIDWSCARAATPRAKNSNFVAPPGTVATGRSIVIAEIKYDFDPFGIASAIFDPGSFQMTRQVYVAPRKSNKIANPTGGCP